MLLDPSDWREFNAPLEGVIPHMYLDVRGLVTTGIGCLIDPMSLALELPWQRGYQPATRDEVADEWWRVKRMKRGLLAARYQGALYLTNVAIDALLKERLEANEAVLCAFFDGFETFPLEAQKAIHSMAWGLGAGSTEPGVTSSEWPRLQAAVRERNWLKAAEECAIKTRDNRGVAARNSENRGLFLEAAVSES